MESKGMNLLEALGKHDRISPKEASRNVREWISTQIFHTYNYHCIAKKKKRGGGGGGRQASFDLVTSDFVPAKEEGNAVPLCQAKPSPSFINLQAKTPPATFLNIQTRPSGKDVGKIS